ncbi:hypothetical protein COEREDRAFT_6262 [Coemansia reversa NRRL 1564]|uniref:Uncharacterized protein n=1 Tax=Coemansia reversa (strain ATCC 12441 / NRRL 1564) TaxID=763665 RepID=A0A2G5BHP2_COERN|nr:hypothetical protein COEREDRAFT_6262 [Coemansia reversa NRRL 1564]|eukprot:PIA18544.1 hypothetical protein COEREDRAFT_6262 [Coemansia reversa NRRL 1564]
MFSGNRHMDTYPGPVPLTLAPVSNNESFEKPRTGMHEPSGKLMAGSAHFRVVQPVNHVSHIKAQTQFVASVPQYTTYPIEYRKQPNYNHSGYRRHAETEHSFSSSSSASSASSPPAPSAGVFPPIDAQHQQQQQHQQQLAVPTRKRSRHAWPAEMTRQIINVLLDEFLTDPGFRTTIYRSREERDHRFIPSGRSILEEYNKVQNIRRRYFIPLSYLLQWDQLRLSANSMRSRQRINIEKKLAKPLERSRLQMIFCAALKATLPAGDMVEDDVSDQESGADTNGKPVFELDIFVTELKRRDSKLWAKGVAAFQAWVSRKCSIDFIINH